jgi:hypothetical protein
MLHTLDDGVEDHGGGRCLEVRAVLIHQLMPSPVHCLVRRERSGVLCKRRQCVRVCRVGGR